MIKLILIGIVVTSVLQIQAQTFPPQVKWEYTIDDSIIGPTKIVETDNHRFVSLFIKSVSSSVSFMSLKELDSTGNVFWYTSLGPSGSGSQKVFYKDLKKVSNGYIVCGSKNTQINTKLLVVTKVNKNGSILWSKYYGDSLNVNFAYSIDLVGDSSYVVSATMGISGTPNHNNSSLVKIDTAGNMLWWKNYFVGNTDNISTPKVITLNNGFGQLVRFNSLSYPYKSEYFLRTNQNGDSVYSYYFPIPLHPASFAKSNLDQSLMFVSKNSDTVAVAQNYSTVKLDPNGLYLSQKNFFFSVGGTSSTAFLDIASKKDSGFVVIGYSVVSGSIIATLIKRISETGDTLWNKETGGTSAHSRWGYSLCSTMDGGCVISGIDKGPFSLSVNHTFLLKLGSDSTFSTSVNTLEKEKIDLNIYPNPTTGDITLELQNFTGKEDLNFCLYDVAGKLLMTQKVETEKSVFSLTDFPNGYYLYDVKNPKENSSGKGKLILIK